MTIFNPDLPFDKSKPFYPLVVSYVTQVHGILDAASRGVLSMIEALGPNGAEMLLAFKGPKDKR
jgi:hypothetical protein